MAGSARSDTKTRPGSDFGGPWWRLEGVEDFAGDVALEAAHHLVLWLDY